MNCYCLHGIARQSHKVKGIATAFTSRGRRLQLLQVGNAVVVVIAFHVLDLQVGKCRAKLFVKEHVNVKRGPHGLQHQVLLLRGIQFGEAHDLRADLLFDCVDKNVHPPAVVVHIGMASFRKLGSFGVHEHHNPGAANVLVVTVRQTLQKVLGVQNARIRSMRQVCRDDKYFGNLTNLTNLSHVVLFDCKCRVECHLDCLFTCHVVQLDLAHQAGW